MKQWVLRVEGHIRVVLCTIGVGRIAVVVVAVDMVVRTGVALGVVDRVVRIVALAVAGKAVGVVDRVAVGRIVVGMVVGEYIG